MATNKRIIMAKMGLDAHDNGLRIVSKWLVDAGYEVIYAGVYNSAEKILRMAIEENADAVGASFLGGEHLHYSRKLLDLFRENGLDECEVGCGRHHTACRRVGHERTRRRRGLHAGDAAERDSRGYCRVSGDGGGSLRWELREN